MKNIKQKVKKEIKAKIKSLGTVWNNKRKHTSISRRTFLNA